MTLLLELTPEQERLLGAEAARRGLDAADYVKAVLFQGDKEGGTPSVAQAQEEPWSGTDLVARWEREGVIGSRTDITDSQGHARAIRSQAERRSHE